MDLRPVEANAPALIAALQGADLPTSDLREPGRRFFVAESDGQTVGFAGYELYGEDVLLRSVVVLPQLRGRGIGRALTAEVLAAARDAGARTAYLLTTTAEVFFEHEGFTRIERDKAPASILTTQQATTICSTAAMLTMPLAPHD